jgi:pimeloyl-ACP methyl ester carboxylesterase
MDFVHTRAGKLAYVSQGSGPPIVLLHSAGHDHHDFDAIVPALARSHRTLAFDWPGFGASPAVAPPSAASAALFCDLLEDAVDALDLPPAIFVGNSVGGTAAVRLAGRRPERVRGLVAVDSGGFTEVNALVRAFCWVQGRAWIRRRFGLAFAARYLRRRNPHVEQILARIADSHRRPETIATYAALWRSFPTSGNDVSKEARQVRCPTLLVWGRHDPVSRPRAEGRRARSLIPHARYVELDVGHTPFAEAPEAFLAELEPFLAALPPASELPGPARPAPAAPADSR